MSLESTDKNIKPKINWKPYIISGIISLLFGTFIFILFAVILKRSPVDGTAYASIILISFAGLIWVTREGFFDIFSYGFRQLGTSIFSKKANEYNDFSTYKNYKYEIREKRPKIYLSLLIVGGLFLLATIILALIYKL